MSEHNRGIIDEFRANAGNVRGFESQPLLLLHHKGAKTGTERINPLAYLRIHGGYAVFATKSGAHTNPDWLYNVEANPDVRIEVGTESMNATARVAEGEERVRIWAEQVAFNADFSSYEEKTRRPYIPVVVLETDE